MKQLKRNDGYVLPYVLIVFLVLSFVAVTICGISVKNLRAQEVSIARTQDLYEAEGYMERYVASLWEHQGESDRAYMDAADATAAAAQDFWGRAKLLNDQVTVSLQDDPSFDDINVLTVEATSNNGSTSIIAELEVRLETDSGESAAVSGWFEGVAKVASNGVEYLTYNISHSDAEGGDGT